MASGTQLLKSPDVQHHCCKLKLGTQLLKTSKVGNQNVIFSIVSSLFFFLRSIRVFMKITNPLIRLVCIQGNASRCI